VLYFSRNALAVQANRRAVKHRSCEQGSFFFFFAKACKHAAELAERLCSASQCYYCFVCWPGWPISLCKPNTGAGSKIPDPIKAQYSRSEKAI
jgi:hypothetical protein